MLKKNKAKINPMQYQTKSSDNSKNIGKLLTTDTGESEIISNINNKYTWYLEVSKPIRRQWLVNSAFTRGHQFHILHRDDDRLIEMVALPGRKKIIVDKIGTWKEHTVANIIAAVPMFEAIPENNDTESVASARAGTALLRYYWDDWRFDVQKIELAGYLVDFGNAFVFINYIADGTKVKAEPVYDATTGESALDETGNPLFTETSLGELSDAVLMPHNICCPLDKQPIEKKPWIIIVDNKELSYFSETYNKGSDVQAENINTTSSYEIERISDGQFNNKSTGEMQYANEKIYLQKPTKKNPDGLVAVVANGILLYKEKWPYKKLMTYPIEHFHYPKEPGEFFARSRVEKQIPIQKYINLLKSIIAENADAMCNLKWLWPINAGEAKITNDNDIIQYNYPYKPEQNVISPLPAYMNEQLVQLYGDIQDVQSYHGASMGSSESGVRSQSHAQNLQDQDMLPINVLDTIVGVSYERMGEKILQIAAEKLDEERIISYIGEDKRRMVSKFKGSMLGNIKKVKVRLDNTWMRNKATVMNNILQMAQYGLITNQYGQPDPNRLLKMLEFGLPQGIFKDMQVHTDMAYYENDMMMQGNPMVVVQWQNHNYHLDCHQEHMNQPEFMKLIMEAQTNPESKQIAEIFIAHITQHSQQMMQSMGALQPKPTQGRQAEEGTSPKEGGNPETAVSK